jgi:mannose-6-phosphate isomerase
MHKSMPATRLVPHKVRKVWGRRDIPPVFGAVELTEEPVGEIWFELPGGGDAELLVKFLFTSERLSIQAHPDDKAAHAKGHRRGKDEAWLILSAEPDSTIGLGTLRQLKKDELRQAALDGSIVNLLDWKSVAPGDLIFSPAGTLHAIGPGLSLIEIQQNCDVTYRLFDYGRPRELHLDEAVAAANPVPFQPAGAAFDHSLGRRVDTFGGAFVVERWSNMGDCVLRHSLDRPLWLVPLASGGRLDGAPLEPGSVWMIDEETLLSLPAGSEVLAAYSGAAVDEDIILRKR